MDCDAFLEGRLLESTGRRRNSNGQNRRVDERRQATLAKALRRGLRPRLFFGPPYILPVVFVSVPGRQSLAYSGESLQNSLWTSRPGRSAAALDWMLVSREDSRRFGGVTKWINELEALLSGPTGTGTELRRQRLQCKRPLPKAVCGSAWVSVHRTERGLRPRDHPPPTRFLPLIEGRVPRHRVISSTP